ncbi:MAG: DUF1501 domain-containing protein [Planctomycetota bacterium]|nr:DUF1501 domain-containing protein [Planctomycetota bacterium]
MNRNQHSKSAPAVTRRNLLRAGSLGLMGLSMTDVLRMRCQAGEATAEKPKAVIYLFLTGGASQHDTFDMKPDGPSEYKGEFNSIATKTPGIQICEHFPLLAQRSDKWALVRSLTHKDNGHDKGTYVMLTGNSVVPPTFRSSQPQSIDLPSIAAIAGYASRPRRNMPPSAILPERIYHSNTGVYPGQFAGLLGPQHEPWLLQCTDKPHAYHDYSGAFPKYLFNLHDGVASDKDDWRFSVPHLTLQEGMLPSRFSSRLTLLNSIDKQRAQLEQAAEVANYDRIRAGVVSLMADPKVREAFDVRNADPKELERYGDNSFGWSLLMARRLVETGVNMVQVNMGNFGSWDLHGNNFPLAKNFLFPPTDRAVSALLDDLDERGMLDSTLIAMAGEFGRTPRIFNVAPNVYKLPGRDHWAPCQSVLFAGGGVRGGNVIGSSDRNGAYPTSDPQSPENFAATIYQALGIPRDANWYDLAKRPYHVYQADPIDGLTA